MDKPVQIEWGIKKGNVDATKYEQEILHISISKAWRRFYVSFMDMTGNKEMSGNIRNKFFEVFIETQRNIYPKLDAWIIEHNNKYRFLGMRRGKLRFVVLQEENGKVHTCS